MSRKYNQFVVYIPPTGTSNEEGNPIFGDAVEYPSRWDEGQDEVISAQGEITSASSVVTLEHDIAVGGLMMQGRLDDLGSSFDESHPMTDRRFLEIIMRKSTPSVKADKHIYQAFLK